MDPVEEVKEGIAELKKGLPADEEKPADDNRSVLQKAVDGMSKALDLVSLGMKKPVDDVDDDKKPEPLKKSGEDRQEEGDQNRLNTGPMNRKQKMAKIFNYMEKMSDAELDEYANAMVTADYRDEARGVHKSLSERLEGASDEDGAVIVTEFLEEMSDRMTRIEKSLDTSLTAHAAVLKGLSAFAQVSKEAGDQGRGRKSALSLVSKSVSGAEVEETETIDWNATMRKALKLSEKGELTAERVSALEYAMNTGHKPDPDTMRIINDAA